MDDVEIQRHFNELRDELLDKRAVSIDRWLFVIALILTFFGVIVALGGYVGFKKFWDIETEARNSARDAAEHAQEAKRILDEMKKYRDKAEEYVSQFELLADRPEFDVSVDEVPKELQIYTEKLIAQADSLQQQGRIDEAIEKWRAIANITEGSDNDLAAEAWYYVGYLFRNENLKECISANTKAIQLKPDYAEAYRNRGAAKGLLGRYEEAIVDFNKAIDLKSDLVGVYNNRGNAKASLEQYPEAMADYNEAIRLKPDDANTYYNRGITKDKLKLIDEARQDFEKARDLARYAGNDHLADLAEQGLRGFGSQEGK